MNGRMKKKILIVDDTPENIDFLVGILKDTYKLVAARDGERALKLVDSPNPPDLILLDIIMPAMDGLEVCRLLQKSEKTARIPVLFISGNTSDADINDGFEAGGVDFVGKPFNAQLVRSRIATHLELSMSRSKKQQE
jgi:putative two-component system response regulator